jgi:hypothetical protein
MRLRIHTRGEGMGMKKRREARPRAEPAKQNVKFVITQWKDDFDYDGLTNYFSVLGEFSDLAEARAYLNDSVDRLTVEQLNEHAGEPGWGFRSIEGKETPWDRVNKNNKVVDYRSFGIGDGTGFNSIYTYLELIELPKDAEVNEKLFDLEDCGYEVRRYFSGIRPNRNL